MELLKEIGIGKTRISKELTLKKLRLTAKKLPSIDLENETKEEIKSDKSSMFTQSSGGGTEESMQVMSCKSMNNSFLKKMGDTDNSFTSRHSKQKRRKVSNTNNDGMKEPTTIKMHRLLQH